MAVISEKSVMDLGEFMKNLINNVEINGRSFEKWTADIVTLSDVDFSYLMETVKEDKKAAEDMKKIYEVIIGEKENEDYFREKYKGSRSNI